MTETLWIPESARPEPRKIYRCNTCGMEFPESQRSQWARHCVACARKNGARDEEMAESLEQNAFTGILDKEQFGYLRREAARRGLLRPGQKGAPDVKTRRRR